MGCSNYKDVKVLRGDGTMYSTQRSIIIFEYKGHTYLEFQSGSTWGVHDPDCKNPIHNKKE